MCGIVGYVGQRPACDIVVDALRRMEYRGYDSSGVALLDGSGGLTVRRRAGRLANLEAALAETDAASLAGSTGLGHTRWATHGRPTDRNAHPHRDAAGKIAVVHNGIIENFAAHARRAGSRRRGVRQRHRHRGRCPPGRPCSTATATPQGLPGLGAVGAAPAARATSRWSSPTPTSRARSSPPAAPRRWCSVSATVRCSSAPMSPRSSSTPATPSSSVRTRRSSSPPTATASPISTATTIPRMLGPSTSTGTSRPPKRAATSTSCSRRSPSSPPRSPTRCSATSPTGRIVLDEQRLSDQELREIDKVFVVACGTAYHSGLLAKYAIEHWTRLPVEVELASEFRYRDPVLDRHTLVVAISQSGETADTLEAVRHAKEQKAKVLAICNTNGQPDSPGMRRGALHPRRAGDRGGVDQDVPGADRRQLPCRTCACAGPRHQVPRRGGA